MRAERLAAALLAGTLCLVSAPSRSQATDAAAEGPPPPQARLQGRAYGFGPLGPKQAGDSVQVEVRLRGEAIRIDFVGAHAPDAYLVAPGTRGRAWLISRSGDYRLPVADASGPYWYDPKDPCARIGGRCAPAPGEFIAGRLAAGWRYQSATQGPDGTTTGTLWLDGNGLLLGYRGRIGNRRDERSLRVDTVSYEPVPADAFEPPEGLRTPGTAAPRR
ncbi:hypothetical protein NRY95_21525 [Xanthomonas campestris pv. phormiicola]|nr:hypothetical protein [Xanthomonas campestris pv. phormiicola]UYC16222.1 hypothetical protein NRY95_21525 [Xanthomonas campestris pv. phormiicola]